MPFPRTTDLSRLKHLILLVPAIFVLMTLLSSRIAYSEEFEPYTDSTTKGFTLPDIKGKTQSLTDYRGKVVLVNFWASWCMPCVQELPDLTQLKQHLAGRPFEILALNVGERENRVKHFAQRMRFNLPVLLDISSKVFNEWDIKIMPTSYLIDANGGVRYRALGNPGWDKEQTLFIIEKLINEAEKSDRSEQ
jgi:thiol-disulfide isomerase/thioredoxin